MNKKIIFALLSLLVFGLVSVSAQEASAAPAAETAVESAAPQESNASGVK